MSESSSVRSPLVRKLRSLDAQPIESPMKSGVPDINYRSGWIECKYKPSWPSRIGADHIIKWPHALGKSQIVWIKRRVNRGGRVILCGKIASDWFFWDCATFNIDLFNNQTRAEIFGSADLHFNRVIKDRELIQWLT